MSTPAYVRENSFRRIDFFTLAGVSKAELNSEGSQVIAVQKNPLSAFRSMEGVFLCAEFANWPSDAAGVLRFTRRYGALTAPIEPGVQFSISVADWKDYQEKVRGYWQFAKACHDQLGWKDHGIDGMNGVPVEKGEEFVCFPEKLEYRTASLFRFILLEFHSIPFESLRMCASSSCSNRYFVATHLSQRYCSALCARSAQSQWKKNWWLKSGEQWRRSRAKKSQRKTSKSGRGVR
jgi:hypothetical protein